MRRLRDAGASTGHALEIFGDRGGPAFEVLSSAIPQIRQFEAEFKKAAGTAERIAEIMDDNLNGALLRVRSAAEAVSLAIGALGANTALTNFLDAVAFLIRAVANHVRLLAIAFTGLIVVLAPALLATVATRFLGISAAAITLRSTLAGIVGVLGGLVRGFASVLLAPIRWLGIIAAKILGIKTAAVTLTAGLSKAALAARLLGKAFAWGLVIEGIFMVVGALYKLIKTVRQTEMTWRDAAVVGIERFVNTIVGGLYALGRIIAGITPVLIDPLIAGFSEVGNQIVDLLLGKISGTDAVAAVANRVSKVFTESLEKTMKDVEDLWNTRYLKLATKLQLTFFGEPSKQPRGSDLPYIPPEFEAKDPIVDETALAIEAGLVLSDKQRAAFGRLRDSLDTVGAAKRRLAEGQELVNTARREGVIFTHEAVRLEAALQETLKSSLDPLYKTKKALQDVQDLRARDIKERRVESEVQQIVTDMRLRGITLSDRETQVLRNTFITRDRTLKQFDREESIYRSLQDPVKEYERRLKALNTVLAKYPELAAQAGKVTRSLRMEFLDTQTSIGAGIERGLLNVSNPFEQTRKAAENVGQAYSSLKDPVKDYELRLKALNAVLEKYPELAAQAGRVTRSLRMEFLDTQTSIDAGIERGLLGAADPFEQTRRAAESVGQAYSSLKDPVKDYELRLKALNAVLEKYPELTAQAGRVTRSLRMEFLDTQTSIDAGIERGLLDVSDPFEQTRKAAESVGQAYNLLIDPVKNYELRLKALNAVLARYPELAAKAGRATRSIRMEFLDTQTSIGAGIELGLLDISDPFKQMKEAVKSVGQAYSLLIDPVKNYELRLKALNAVLAKHPELSAQAAEAARSIRMEFLSTQTSVAAGIERGLLDVSDPLKQMKEAAESVGQAYDSLIDPVNNYELRLKALNAVLTRYPELSDRAARATRSIRMEFLNTQTSVAAGIERGLLDVSDPSKQMKEAAKSVGRAYSSLRDPVSRYELQLKALNAVLEKYPELTDRAARATRSLRIEFLNTQTSVGAGIERGLLDVSDPFKQMKEAAESVGQAYDSLIDPVGRYELRLKALNAVLAKYPELSDQAADAVRDLRVEFLSTQTSLSAGMERGLLDFSKNMMDGAKQMEQAIVNTFGNMEQALLDFVSTGKFSFKNMVDAMVADLARLLIRTQILGPFAAFFSGLGFKDGGLAMASGGLARGPGTSRSDSIPAYLSNGEFVVNQRATRDYLPQLDRINRGQAPNSGGGGTNVYVVDQRTTQDSEPAQIEHGTGGDGKEFIRVTIRDGVRESISSGEIDRPMFHRYGLRPVLS